MSTSHSQTRCTLYSQLPHQLSSSSNTTSSSTWKVRASTSVVKDTIFKIVSCILKIHDSFLSCTVRIFRETVLTKVKIRVLLEDNFPKIHFTKIT